MKSAFFSILTALCLLASAVGYHEVLAAGSSHHQPQGPVGAFVRTSSPRTDPSTPANPKQWSPAEGGVADALEAEPRLHGSYITVTINKDYITLVGNVPHRYQKRLAGKIARRVGGPILNHIRVVPNFKVTPAMHAKPWGY